VVAERLLLGRGLRMGVDQHEVHTCFFQPRDCPIDRLEGSDPRSLDKHPSEHVDDAHPYAVRLEEPPAPAGRAPAEVRGPHNPLFHLQEPFLTFSVKGMVA
jgi:hypothetical protein